MSYTCHSGGCPGSDMEWEIQGETYGVKTIAYSFKGHNQKGKNPKVLTADELNEGYNHVLEANKGLKRNVEYIPYYVKCLLSRNWFQVKNSEVVFAIGKFLSDKVVAGGTGWAVQMAIDNNKPIYVFDQEANLWTTFIYPMGIFTPYGEILKLTENFAGIGTREINDNGKQAIAAVYEKNFTESKPQ